MEITPKEIREYLTREGRSPFSEWLNSLKDIKAKALIRVRLDRIQLGNLGDVKTVGEGVQELRVNHGPGYRIYIGQDGEVLIILLSGGSKKTQKKEHPSYLLKSSLHFQASRILAQV